MRIVSLCPSNTELLFALGLGPQVVGVDEYSDFPLAARGLPKIGTDLTVDIEAVRALKPDLVVASLSVPGMEANVQAIREAGFRHIVLETERFTDFLADLWEIGAACGVEDEATRLVDEYNTRIKTILDHAPALPEAPRIYFELWPTPYISPGRLSWITDILSMAGGMNVFLDIEGGSRPVTDEQVIDADPQAIFLCWQGEKTADMTPEAIAAVAQRPGWKAIDAVQHNRILTVPEGLFGRPGPRLLDALELMIDLISQMFITGDKDVFLN